MAEQEFAPVRRHPAHTCQILARVARLRDLSETAASHHERTDGRGDRRGITAGGLPVAARILAVADLCDALSAERPYRAALPRERVLEIMRTNAGAGVCPECFHALEHALVEWPDPGLRAPKTDFPGAIL